MRLKELELTNFKGVRLFRMVIDGKSATIYGDNGTGKTTIEDAYCYLLTGKDHLGRSEMNFDIKTLDENGDAIPMIDHTVRGVFVTATHEIELVRTFKEVWTRKRGSDTDTFTGHNTEYFINGTPKSEKEYSAFIEKMCELQLLRVLMINGYFNEQMDYKDRRKMLLEMCGDVSETEMLSLPEWADLAQHVCDMVTVADLKKSKSAQKTKINDELKVIPAKIDAHSQYLKVDGLNADVLKEAISICNEQIELREKELSGLKNGETLSMLRKELAELETAQIEAGNVARKKYQDATEKQRERLQLLLGDRDKLAVNINDFQHEAARAKVRMRDLSGEKDILLKKYEDAEISEFKGNTTCPTCNQPLPADSVAAAIEKFNENKAKRLETIVAEGRARVDAIEECQRIIDTRTNDAAEEQKTLDSVNSKITTLKQQIAAAVMPLVEFDVSLIENKKAEIEVLRESTAEKEAKLRAGIDELRRKRTENQRGIDQLDNAKKAQTEIDALKFREKQLAAQYEECEHFIFRCDEFTNARVKMLDEKISGFFRKARFKLTETQINGGLKEICDTMIDGVPYSAANNAAKINVGLDIIQTFSRHYGVTMSVFIDNAESVTALEDIDAQVIRLVVSETDKNLRIEVM